MTDPQDTPLNPGLKPQTESVYNTEDTTPAPADSASAKEGEGEGWPLAWVAIVAICVIVTLFLIF